MPRRSGSCDKTGTQTGNKGQGTRDKGNGDGAESPGGSRSDLVDRRGRSGTPRCGAGAAEDGCRAVSRANRRLQDGTRDVCAPDFVDQQGSARLLQPGLPDDVG